MMIKTIYISIIFVILLNKIGIAQNKQDSISISISTLQNKHVSIIQLLANPEKYHDEKIIVSGYIHLKFEDSAIYLSKKQADYILSDYAIWINFGDSVRIQYLNNGQYVNGEKEDLKILDCKFVSVKGKFNKNNHGHLGAFHSCIENIELIFELRKWYDGKIELH